MADFMSSEPNLEPQLAVARKKERIPTLNAPGLIWLLIVLVLILLGLSVNLLGNSEELANPASTFDVEPVPTETRQPRIYTVSYKNGVFSPTNLRIHAGDTVRFKNE